MLVFVGQGDEGPPQLWLRAMDSGAARPLVDTEDPTFPFWSPASDAIGFFAGSALKTMAVAGGPARVLAAASNGRGGSWGVDGTILYVPAPTSPVLKISDRGGQPEPVTTGRCMRLR